jgi:sulfoxide reductase heme-binding subunit YedZ
MRQVSRIAVFALCSLPFMAIVYDVLYERLGPEPIQALHFRTGDWTLRLLTLTLTCTPLRQLFGWNFQQRYRRMLGLFTFFYATLHLLVYLVLDQSLSLDNIREDVPKSPYVVLGLGAYLLMLPLAITSNDWSMRKLRRRWKRLHRLVYLAATAAVIHFFWLVKRDLTEPTVYAGVLLFLFAVRIWHEHATRQRTSSRRQPALRAKS